MRLNILSIVLILFCHNIPAKETPIIFKGKSVAFKKIDHDTFEGQFDNKKIIATTKLTKSKNNKLYLGAFRRLKRKHQDDPEKKLVTYHVYEKH